MWTAERDMETDKWGPKVTTRQKWEHKNRVKKWNDRKEHNLRRTRTIEESDSRSDSRESVYKNPRPFRQSQRWKGGRSTNTYKPVPKRKGNWEEETSMDRGKVNPHRHQERRGILTPRPQENVRRGKKRDETGEGCEHQGPEEHQRQIHTLQGKVKELRRYIQEIEQGQGKSIPRKWKDGEDLRGDEQRKREERDGMRRKSQAEAEPDWYQEGSSTERRGNRWQTEEVQSDGTTATKWKKWEEEATEQERTMENEQERRTIRAEEGKKGKGTEDKDKGSTQETTELGGEEEGFQREGHKQWVMGESGLKDGHRSSQLSGTSGDSRQLKSSQDGVQIINLRLQKAPPCFSEEEKEYCAAAALEGSVSQTHYTHPDSSVCYRCPLCAKLLNPMGLAKHTSRHFLRMHGIPNREYRVMIYEDPPKQISITTGGVMTRRSGAEPPSQALIQEYEGAEHSQELKALGQKIVSKAPGLKVRQIKKRVMIPSSGKGKGRKGMKGKGKPTKRKSTWAYRQLEELFDKPEQVKHNQEVSNNDDLEQGQRSMDMDKGIDQGTEVMQIKGGDDQTSRNWQQGGEAKQTPQCEEDYPTEGKNKESENKKGGSWKRQPKESAPYEHTGYGQKKRQRTILEYMEASQHGSQERSVSRNHETTGQQEAHMEKWTKEDDKQGMMRKKGAEDEQGPMMATDLANQMEKRTNDERRSQETL